MWVPSTIKIPAGVDQSMAVGRIVVKTKAMCRSSAITPQIETIGPSRLTREYRRSTGEDANAASNKRLATPQ
jgi:hypothetical protein